MKNNTKAGRPPNVARRERIRKLMAEGKTQIEIARLLKVSAPTVARYVRGLGVEPIPYKTPKPVRGGKRQCVVCGHKKKLAAFANKWASTCRDCRMRAKYAS